MFAPRFKTGLQAVEFWIADRVVLLIENSCSTVTYTPDDQLSVQNRQHVNERVACKENCGLNTGVNIVEPGPIQVGQSVKFILTEAGEEENALLLRNTGESLSSQEEYNRRVDERKEQEQQRKLFQETKLEHGQVAYIVNNKKKVRKGIEAAFAYPVTLEKRLKMFCSRFMKYMVMLGTAETLQYGFAFYDNNASVYHVVSICSKDWHYTRMSLHENGTSLG
ncbi:hypothetical protein Tco_0856059 [Tanacetum coccineum]